MARPRYGNTKHAGDGVVEAHDLSGIPSLAAWKVAEKVGADNIRAIWYSALTDHMKPHSGFAGAAQATQAAAETLYGKNSNELAAVRDT